MDMKINRLEVIIKVTERCNINCTYCYYFNGNNNDYTEKPKYISQATINQTANFIKNAIIKHKISIVQIDLHGGEPLIMGKKRFALMSETFHNTLDSLCNLLIIIQTNGILIDDEWIKIFADNKISVSVSIDGTKSAHDAHRIDFKGRGTYDKVLNGIKLLQKAREEKKIVSGAIICVINPTANGAEVYRHLVDQVGAKRIHFIEPDHTRDNIQENEVLGVKNFFMSVLREWKKDNTPKIDKEISVRIFNIALLGILNNEKRSPDKNTFDAIAITIRSDGAINPLDDLRNVKRTLFNNDYTIFNNTLDQFISSPDISSVQRQITEIPNSCQDCGFKLVCKGGTAFANPANRYSTASGFNNRSIYCSIYQEMLLDLCRFVMAKGVAWESIETALMSSQKDEDEQEFA